MSKPLKAQMTPERSRVMLPLLEGPLDHNTLKEFYYVGNKPERKTSLNALHQSLGKMKAFGWIVGPIGGFYELTPEGREKAMGPVVSNATLRQAKLDELNEQGDN